LPCLLSREAFQTLQTHAFDTTMMVAQPLLLTQSSPAFKDEHANAEPQDAWSSVDVPATSGSKHVKQMIHHKLGSAKAHMMHTRVCTPPELGQYRQMHKHIHPEQQQTQEDNRALAGIKSTKSWLWCAHIAADDRFSSEAFVADITCTRSCISKAAQPGTAIARLKVVTLYMQKRSRSISQILSSPSKSLQTSPCQPSNPSTQPVPQRTATQHKQYCKTRTANRSGN
jgi:hypothetical protein